MRAIRAAVGVPSYFRVACSLLPLGIDGGFFFVATDSYMFDEAFELDDNRLRDEIGEKRGSPLYRLRIGFLAKVKECFAQL